MIVEPLDPLDRRIAAALQIDGRASWRTIAQALNESVRTVGRRGNALFDTGVVRITALPGVVQSFVVTVHTAPDQIDPLARQLADRPDTVFVYTLSNLGSLVCEVLVGPGSDIGSVAAEIAAVPSVERCTVSPVLQYFRTVASWRPGILNAAETAALERVEGTGERDVTDVVLNTSDQAIVDALVANGRTPYDVLGAAAGVSEATARRRVDALVNCGAVGIRAVVDPAAIGLPIESMVWIDVSSDQAVEVGTALARSPLVRYAALLLGQSAIVADVAANDRQALAQLLAEPPWRATGARVRVELVLTAYKRSGLAIGSAEG